MSIILLGSNVSPLTVTLSHSSVFGARLGPGSVTTYNVTATPQGGVSPYTYAWTLFSGDATITATAATSAVTAWTTTVATNQIKTATFKLIVTDTLGTASPPVYIDIDIEEINFQ